MMVISWDCTAIKRRTFSSGIKDGVAATNDDRDPVLPRRYAGDDDNNNYDNDDDDCLTRFD